MTDLFPSCTIIVFNLAFFPFFIPLTCAKKWCQHMPPSFGVKYPFTPKLFLNHNYFLQTVASKVLRAVLMKTAHQSRIPISEVGSPYKYVSILPLPLLHFLHSGHLFPCSKTHLLLDRKKLLPSFANGFHFRNSSGTITPILFCAAISIWDLRLFLIFPFSTIISRPLGTRSSSLCPSNPAWSV